jgi:hypothetical protein
VFYLFIYFLSFKTMFCYINPDYFSPPSYCGLAPHYWSVKPPVSAETLPAHDTYRTAGRFGSTGEC